MAFQLDFREAEITRNELTKEQEQEIRNLYKKVANKIKREAKKLPNTTSGSLRKMYLNGLEKQINEELKNMRPEMKNVIKGNMRKAADAVIFCNLSFLNEVNMPLEGAFSHVARDVVESVASGKLYSGDWSLSSSIWGHTRKTQKDIQSIIAEGIIQNKGAYDIAKVLEKYVDPSARKPWDWGKVYPGVAKQVDYNAQRLARTMVSHAYQQSFVRTTQPNPFVTKYKWLASNSGRVCELCGSRDGVLFDKDDLPLDHPNGMCTFIAVMPDSLVDIADRISDWTQGADDPELDRYSEFLSKS